MIEENLHGSTPGISGSLYIDEADGEKILMTRIAFPLEQDGR